MLSNTMPANIQALGVYIYEGVSKGAHILSNIKKTKDEIKTKKKNYFFSFSRKINN